MRPIESGAGVSPKPAWLGYSRYVGSVGALAVALGVGAAIASMPAVAFADETGPGGSTDGGTTGNTVSVIETAAAPPTAPNPNLTLRYDLSAGEGNTLDVHMTIENPGDGQVLDIFLPETFEKAGGKEEEKLYEAIDIGQIDGAESLETGQPKILRIKFENTTEPARIEYNVRQLFEGPPSEQYGVFYNSFQPMSWYFSSHSTLLMPDRPGDLDIAINFVAPAGQSDWKLLSAVGSDTDGCGAVCTIETTTTRDAFFAHYPGRPHDGIAGGAQLFLFGDLIYEKRTLSQGPYTVHLGMTGPSDVIPDVGGFFNDMAAIMESERNFFTPVEGQTEFFYLINTYTSSETDRFGGFWWGDGVTTFVPKHFLSTTERKGDLSIFNDLRLHVSHEYSHNWLRPEYLAASAKYDFGIWAEGFADFMGEYFAYATNADSDSFATYASRYNRFMSDYWDTGELVVDGQTIDGRTIGLEKLKKVFWDNPGYEKQPYYRGFLLLFNWNAKVQEEGEGEHIQDFIRDLVVEGSDGSPLTLDEIQRIAATYWTGGLTEDLNAYWLNDQAELIRPHPQVFGPCYDVFPGQGDAPPSVKRNEAKWAELGEENCTACLSP